MKLARLFLLGCAAVATVAGACSSESAAPVGAAAASTSGSYCDVSEMPVCTGCVNPNIGYLPTCVNDLWICQCPTTSTTSSASSGGGGASGNGGAGGNGNGGASGDGGSGGPPPDAGADALGE